MKITVSNTTISLPDDYKITRDYAMDNATVLLGSSDCSNELVIIRNIKEDECIPWNKTDTVNGIREYLNENQGIIEVKQNEDYRAHQYIYSIVKNVDRENGGCQYISTFQMKGDNNDVIMIQGNFIEAGQTGIRDTVVANKLIRKGEVTVEDKKLVNWFIDPYDPTYNKGMPMNKSEDSIYDKEFKDHPLSRTRRLIKYLIKHNEGNKEA